MDKKIEQKDLLFLNVDDVAGNGWVINKKHIVSVVAPYKTGAITRIVLSSDAVIDTYLNIGTIRGYLSDIEHKIEIQSDSKD